MRKLVLFVWAFVAVSGCANVQLKHTTVNQASTLTNLQYQLVLENLAMIYANRSALPWHVNLPTGTAQVTDFGSAAFAMGFGRQMGILRSYSPTFSAQRTIVETWGLAHGHERKQSQAPSEGVSKCPWLAGVPLERRGVRRRPRP